MSTQEHSTAYYIFETKFLCLTMPDAMITDDEIRLFGTRTSLDRAADYQIRNKLTRFYLSIAQMVEITGKGYPVSVVKQGDTLKIYNYVQNHINAWLEACANPLNLRKIPREDLLELENFANIVYPHAVTSPVEQIAASSSGGMYNSRVTRLIEELMRKPINTEYGKEKQAETHPEAPQYAPRRSLVQELRDLKGVDI